MSRAVINSSVIIALSTVGYLNNLKPLFKEVIVANAVFDEICIKGHGLIGSSELDQAVKTNLIHVRKAKNCLLVNALLDPLALGEAETISIASDEKIDFIVLDDRAARRRAKAMKLNVIGTLRILRLMYDQKLIQKDELIKALDELRETGFRISKEVINKVSRDLK